MLGNSTLLLDMVSNPSKASVLMDEICGAAGAGLNMTVDGTAVLGSTALVLENESVRSCSVSDGVGLAATRAATALVVPLLA